MTSLKITVTIAGRKRVQLFESHGIGRDLFEIADQIAAEALGLA